MSNQYIRVLVLNDNLQSFMNAWFLCSLVLFIRYYSLNTQLWFCTLKLYAVATSWSLVTLVQMHLIQSKHQKSKQHVPF